MLLRRTLYALLAVLMVVTLVTACSVKKDVAGGSTGDNAQTNTQAGKDDKKGTDTDELGLPIVKEPLTLTYFVPLNANAAAVVKNYGEIECMKVIKEKTGIDIEWLHPPAGQEAEQFNLMISTNNLPDMIEYNWTNYAGGPEKALQDGVFIRLNEVIDKYAPNLKKILNDNPQVKKQVTTDSGLIYTFPYLQLDPELEGPFRGFQIRKDWLDKLNLKMPETIDEWYGVLTAFKKNDPNGNGKDDEIPFGAVGGSTGSELRNFMTAWGMTADYGGWYKIDDKIQFAFSQPEYFEFLKTMAKWYKEGLIDPDYAITDAKAFDSKVTTSRIGSYFGYPASRLGRYMTLMEKENPSVKLAGVPYPVLKKGDKPVVGHKNNNFIGIGTVITTKNKHVEESARWLDFRFSKEGHMLLDYGIEGKSYIMKDGVPVYTEEITKNPEGLPISRALAKYCMASWGTPRVHDFQSEKQMQARPEQVEALKVWFIPSKDRNLPPITQSPEESQKYAKIMNEINTFINETENKVIMGVIAIENFNFDEYVKTLKGMGLDEAIKIQQAALDRYNRR
ncbi:MAG: extracellular solute-binding protein [Firmicutes bacterium]|nr:extracellular solute-binding protein [Bacillota bacterium]